MEQEPFDVRLPLMVSKSQLAAIDTWRYANHIPTRAVALRRLIEAGLRAATQPRSVGPEDEARGGDEALGVPAPPRDD